MFKAFKEGKDAFENYEPSEANPYDSRKDFRWLLWDLGWWRQSTKYSFSKETLGRR